MKFLIFKWNLIAGILLGLAEERPRDLPKVRMDGTKNKMKMNDTAIRGRKGLVSIWRVWSVYGGRKKERERRRGGEGERERKTNDAVSCHLSHETSPMELERTIKQAYMPNDLRKTVWVCVL